MNAHFPAPTDQRVELREYIAENISLAMIQAEIILRFAELGDDRGLEYALRRYTAYNKAALQTFADLLHRNQREAGRG